MTCRLFVVVALFGVLFTAAPAAEAVPAYSHDIGSFATAEISPLDVVRDAAGNWYVLEGGLSCIKVYDPALTLVRVLFSCGEDGTDAAHIRRPRGIGVDPNTGHVWIADTNNQRLLKVDPLGNVLIETQLSDAPGGPLYQPIDVAIDGGGRAFVIDMRDRVIRVSAKGAYVKEWGSSGSGAGQMIAPMSITYSDAGGEALYVTDARNYEVDKWGPWGWYKRSFGWQGKGDGQLTKDARGVAVDASGVIYAADTGGNRIVRWEAGGPALPSLGNGRPYYRSGPLDFFYGARGISVAGDTLAISDTWNFRVLLWTLGGEYVGEIGNGLPPLGGLLEPHGVALDANGNVYVTDYWHHWVQKFAPDGTFLARWGIGRGFDPGTLNFAGGLDIDDTRGYIYIANREQNVVDRWHLSDGSFHKRFYLPGGSCCMKGWPRDVAVDETTGNFAVADEKNGQVVITSPSGETLGTLTTYGASGEPLGAPHAVAVDDLGRLYVGDFGLKKVHVYDPTGAWLQSFSTLDRPNGLEVANGVVYVLSWRVSEYTTAGDLIRKWGSTGSGDDQLNKPYVGIAVDSSGRIYIGDSKNHRVKVFTP